MANEAGKAKKRMLNRWKEIGLSGTRKTGKVTKGARGRL